MIQSAKMADQLKRERMASVEELRIKAFALGGPLGNVLSRSFDLMNTVIRDGIADEKSVSYAIESLSNERVLAKNRDEKSADPLRHLTYGLVESMGTMLESIREGQRNAAKQPAVANTRNDGKGLTNAQENDVEKEADITHVRAEKEQLGDSNEQDPSDRQQDVHESAADSDEDKSARKRRLSSSDEDDENNSRASETPRSRNQTNSRLRPRRTSSDKRRSTRNHSGPKRYGDESEDEMGSWGRRPEAEEDEADPSSQEVSAHSCELCDRQFETPRALKMHMIKHSGIPCKLCNKYVSSKAKLDQHMTSFHKMKTRSAYVKQTLDKENSDDDFIDDENEDEEEEEGEDYEKKEEEEEEDETSEDEVAPPPRRSTRVIPKNMFVLS